MEPTKTIPSPDFSLYCIDYNIYGVYRTLSLSLRDFVFGYELGVGQRGGSYRQVKVVLALER